MPNKENTFMLDKIEDLKSLRLVECSEYICFKTESGNLRLALEAYSKTAGTTVQVGLEYCLIGSFLDILVIDERAGELLYNAKVKL